MKLLEASHKRESKKKELKRERNFGKNMRRLVRLVCQALQNPGKFLKSKI